MGQQAPQSDGPALHTCQYCCIQNKLKCQNLLAAQFLTGVRHVQFMLQKASLMMPQLASLTRLQLHLRCVRHGSCLPSRWCDAHHQQVILWHDTRRKASCPTSTLTLGTLHSCIVPLPPLSLQTFNILPILSPTPSAPGPLPDSHLLLLHDVSCNHRGDARHVIIGHQVVAVHVQLLMMQTLSQPVLAHNDFCSQMIAK